jgi:hypothetical protein
MKLALGQLLAEYAKGREHDKISRAVGKSKPYFGGVTRGHFRASLEALLALLKELGVSSDDGIIARTYLAAAQVEDPEMRRLLVESIPEKKRLRTRPPESLRAVRR